MKKIILCAIFTLLFFPACNMDFGLDDNGDDTPNIILPKPQVAFDATGNAVVVWHQGDGTRNNIWYSKFSFSSPQWEDAVLLTEDNSGDSVNPRVAVNGSGKTVVVWEHKDDMMVNIWANILILDAWSGAELIGTNDSGDASSPDIAIDSSGEAIAVWSQFDGTSNNIYFNKSTGSVWDGAELVESNDNDNYTPNIKFYSPGNALVVWQQNVDTSESIYSSTYNSGTGLWGEEEKIGEDNVDIIYEAQIAIDPSGNVLALSAWGRYEDEIWEVYTNVLDADLKWGEATSISNIPSSGEFDPQLAFDASGNAIAVWRHYDGKNYIINSTRFKQDSGWSSDVKTISAPDTKYAFEPQIAVDPSGNAIAVWHQSDNKIWKIYANRYVVDSGWIDAEVIGSHDSENLKNPYLSIDSSGNAIVVWVQGSKSIWARRFDGSAWENAVEISSAE